MSQFEQAFAEALDEELGIPPEPAEETPAVEEEVEAGTTVEEEPSDDEEQEPAEDEPVAEPDEQEEEGEDTEEQEDEEATEPGELESEPESLALVTEDPEVLTLLRRFDNDIEAALKTQVQQERAFSRQGREKHALSQRVEQLEQQLEQQTMFSQQPQFLSDEQQAWVEEAVNSEMPTAYIQQAVQAGEFTLARAVVEQWSTEAPYPALRAGQAIDQAEYQAIQAQAPPEQFDMSDLLQAVATYYPDLPQYEQQMVQVIATLGEGHPLVVSARGNDPEEAARGVIGLYEIARAKTTTVETTKAGVRAKQREAGTRARQQAVVSSSESSPAQPASPPSPEIAKGLTFDQYLEELA